MHAVSGEIDLSGPRGGGWTARFVEALALLVDHVDHATFAVIGGLAVMCRLPGGAYRATDDIDTAAERGAGEEHSHLYVLTNTPRPMRGIAARIDCIEVGDTAASDLHSDDMPDDPSARAFVLAHRWAFDTATSLALSATLEDGSSVAATVRVASPAALVAMKLVSAPGRPGAQAGKRASDLADLFSLTSYPDLARAIAVQLAAAPHGLGGWCADRLGVEFVDGATRSARAIEMAGLPVVVTPGDLDDVGSRLATAIREEMGGR